MDPEPVARKVLKRKKPKAKAISDPEPPPQIDNDIFDPQSPSRNSQETTQPDTPGDVDRRYQDLLNGQSDDEEVPIVPTKTTSLPLDIEDSPQRKKRWTKKDDRELDAQMARFSREKTINFPKTQAKEKDILGVLNNLKKRAKTFQLKPDIMNVIPKLKPDRIEGIPLQSRVSRHDPLESDDSDFELEVVQYIGGDEYDENEPTQRAEGFDGETATQTEYTQVSEKTKNIEGILEEEPVQIRRKIPVLLIDTTRKGGEEKSGSGKTPSSTRSDSSISSSFETRGMRLVNVAKQTPSLGTPNSQNSRDHSEEEDVLSEDHDEDVVSHQMSRRHKISRVKQTLSGESTPTLSSLSVDPDRFQIETKKRKRTLSSDIKSQSAVQFAKEFKKNENGIKKVGAIRLTKQKDK